jgi:pimeloyl-ACP methyl ester carboxylesterase
MRRKWAFAFTGDDWDGYIAAAMEARTAPWGAIVDPLFSPDSLGWAFMRSLRDFEPIASASRLSLPVLVVFGELDDEQPVERSRAAWEAAFRESGNERHRIVTIPGATHSLWFGAGNPRPIVGEPTELIGAWLQELEM